MRLNQWDEHLVVEFDDQPNGKGGRGIVDGYVSRGRGKRARVCAIVRIGKRLIDVPLSELRVVQSRKKER